MSPAAQQQAYARREIAVGRKRGGIFFAAVGKLRRKGDAFSVMIPDGVRNDIIDPPYKLIHNNHHADRFALGTNRDERELTNGRLSCKIKFEEEAYYNAR